MLCRYFRQHLKLVNEDSVFNERRKWKIWNALLLYRYKICDSLFISEYPQPLPYVTEQYLANQKRVITKKNRLTLH